MGALTESIAVIVELLEKARVDAEKAETGNKAAGTRYRGFMQRIKTVAHEGRKSAIMCRDSKK